MLVVGGLAALPASAGAQVPVSLGTGVNDLFALGQAGGQTPAMAPVIHGTEPPLTATPRASCGPGSHPEPGIQGRVPAGSAAAGLSCNVNLVSHQGSSGGFKVLRYVDAAGHECAFYDTALLLPLNAINPGGSSLGVAVLDMSDPAHPVQSDTLTALPMLSPHESVTLNTRRGLLAAVNGNPATAPGLVAIYDVHGDCRHPLLQSTAPVARFGHESGFSPDGNTFYATATAFQEITAIDVSDPKNPHAVWQGNIISHGLTLSDDGNRAYIADPTGGDMLILDTSEIQARKPNPQAREISRLTWTSASIPQNAIPFTEAGRPYVLEFDEYTAAVLNPAANADSVGAARIIDVADESHPRVIANLRLQVNQAADHHAAAGDPGSQNPVQGYAAHYCNLPTRVDPKLVACSFIASGLRLFDITTISAPREIGYFVAPPKAAIENGFMASSFAMSQPAFVPERREVWYSDGTSGFYVLRVDPGVWPASPAAAPHSLTSSGGASSIPACAGPRRMTFSLHRTRFGPIVRVRLYVGRRLALSRKGASLKRVSLSLKAGGRQRIRILTYDRHGLARASVRFTERCSSSSAPRIKSRRR
ncbi:MAG: hypothetical protein NVSMB51_20120 [Solirubrobacteraceae bacterium]